MHLEHSRARIATPVFGDDIQNLQLAHQVALGLGRTLGIAANLGFGIVRLQAGAPPGRQLPRPPSSGRCAAKRQ